MLYTLYEMQRAAFMPLRAGASLQAQFWKSPLNPFATTEFGRSAAAAADVFESITRQYGKPEWGKMETQIAGVAVPVEVVAEATETWCSLLHFKRDSKALTKARAAEKRIAADPDPKMLIVAPLSGHYATLLRSTVTAFLPTHDVYITDWADARMVPLSMGDFNLDDYAATLRRMIGAVGPASNVVAVCQPGPIVLAVVALMSEDNDPNLPRTMTFMGSPIDARQSPTQANRLAETRDMAWFEN
ncbi:MAG: polyhydroxyalkanoate depolymerase, partial [Caulobacterales bacterium]